MAALQHYLVFKVVISLKTVLKTLLFSFGKMLALKSLDTPFLSAVYWLHNRVN